jgi:hypothetical protein
MHGTMSLKNHQSDAKIFQFIILTFVYSSTCFGHFPAHHQELDDCSSSLWFYLRTVVIVVLCSWSGRPARPRTSFVHGLEKTHHVSFLNRAWKSRCTVITDLDTSKPSTQKAFSCCNAILKTGPAVSKRSELLLAHEKLGYLPLLTVYVVPV